MSDAPNLDPLRAIISALSGYTVKTGGVWTTDIDNQDVRIVTLKGDLQYTRDAIKEVDALMSELTRLRGQLITTETIYLEAHNDAIDAKAKAEKRVAELGL